MCLNVSQLNVAVAARTIFIIDHMWSTSVSIFEDEKAFDLSWLPKDNENVIETREMVQFGNESFSKSFVSIAVGKFDG